MKITVHGRKMTPSDAFKQRVEKKFDRFTRLFGEDAEATVTASIEKSQEIVEITVYSDGMIFRSEEAASTLEDALDRSMQILIRQMRKNKSKIESRLRQGALEDFLKDLDGETVEEETEFDIVRSKSILLRPKTVEEAILQMNMLGHEFFMFLNADTGKVGVVYRRKNKGYGLIESE